MPRYSYYWAHREAALVQQKKYQKEHRAERNAYERTYNARQPVLVYRYDRPDGTTVYVGRGSRSRIRSHKYTKDWWNTDLIVTSEPCETEAHAMIAEGQWILKYQPTENIEGRRK